jgi:LmbE family N-acetylglucosaminyl deacetylase
MLRLMCITAHPDDEASNFGGTLRLYADRGVETSVVCLTPGQAGSHRGVAKSDSELAAMRREEFAAACEILNVKHAAVLDYPDGRLHRQESYHVAADLVRRVREFKPQIVLTFGPEGGLTGHTDHTMASVLGTLAFHWAGRANRFPEQLAEDLRVHQPQKLYYCTARHSLPGYPAVSLAPVSASIEIGDLYKVKLAAFKAHLTQAPLLPMFERYVGQQRQELFHLAASTVTSVSQQEIDLFAGIPEARGADTLVRSA